MSHSPEPWKIAATPPGHEGEGRDHLCWIQDSSGYFVAETEYADRVEEVARADAERIVACVNACKGIPTEWLEKQDNHLTRTIISVTAGAEQLVQDALIRGCDMELLAIPKDETVSVISIFSPEAEEQRAINYLRRRGYQIADPHEPGPAEDLADGAPPEEKP